MIKTGISCILILAKAPNANATSKINQLSYTAIPLQPVAVPAYPVSVSSLVGHIDRSVFAPKIFPSDVPPRSVAKVVIFHVGGS